MRAALFAVIAVAIIFAFGGVAIDASMTGGDRVDVENEDFDVDTTTTVELEDSHLPVRYDTLVDVQTTNGKTMLEGHDYTWNQANGTLEIHEDGRLANETNGEISYGYATSSSQQEEMSESFAYLGEIAPALLIFLMVTLLLLAMARFK